MRFPKYSARQRAFLLALAVFGAVVPNGLFLYYAALHRQLLVDALSNPVALVFICEPFDSGPEPRSRKDARILSQARRCT